MITLNEYLYKPIITEELFNIFEECINSTYNENVLCESLLFEDEENQKENNKNEIYEAANVAPEVTQTAETESNIIKNDLVKKVASEVNIDILSLGKLYVQITKQLSESNKLTKEMIDTIANTNDNDAIIGLNLMLLGAVTTKNLPNRSKIISKYCTIIQKSIEQNNYDKIFNK